MPHQRASSARAGDCWRMLEAAMTLHRVALDALRNELRGVKSGS